MKNEITDYGSSTVYTIKQVAEILHCGQNYVRKLNKAGLLQFMKLGSLKVRKETLDEFLRKYDGMDLSDPFHIVPLPFTPDNKLDKGAIANGQS